MVSQETRDSKAAEGMRITRGLEKAGARFGRNQMEQEECV